MIKWSSCGFYHILTRGSNTVKATIIMGSPRGRKGASSRAAERFGAGLRRAGVETAEILLKDHDIRHCIGCFTCWTKTPGRCIHRDDMDELLPCWRADLLVWATPLYYYSVPGIVKDVIDRQLPLVEPFMVGDGDTTRHPWRGDAPPPAAFLIAVAGFPERSHFDPLVATFKKFGTNYLGDILIGGSEPMSRPELQETYDDLYQLIEQAGFEVGSLGRVQADTAAALLKRTAFSPEQIDTFRKIGNTHWEAQIAQASAPNPAAVPVSDRVLKISEGGMASLLAGMAANYNPAILPGFSGVIQFRFETESYHLIIREERCRAYPGEHPSPTMTIIASRQVWLDISAGKLNGSKAYLEGKYTVEGDLNLLTKLNRLFAAEGAEGEVPAGETAAATPAENGIPEQRGPIHLTGMTWLTVAFLPWMILWIWGSLAPGPLPRSAAAAAAVLIAAYHLNTNILTFFEAGSAVYLICAAALQTAGWKFFIQFGPVVDYLFLGGLWLVSLARQFAVSAEYSRYRFPKVIWNLPPFTRTNTVISAAWGVYFLAAALLQLLAASGSAPKAALATLTYLLLVPMFVFTGWFQKWYPEQLTRARKARH